MASDSEVARLLPPRTFRRIRGRAIVYSYAITQSNGAGVYTTFRSLPAAKRWLADPDNAAKGVFEIERVGEWLHDDRRTCTGGRSYWMPCPVCGKWTPWTGRLEERGHAKCRRKAHV